MSALDYVVLGAGFSGLAAARVFARAGLVGRVIEKAPRVGGVARSDRIGGFLVERGPNTFRVSGELASFFREHDLMESLLRASPASRKRFLLQNAELVSVPMGVASLLSTPLLSTAGKLRLLREPFVGRAPRGREGESVSEFVTRRLGSEVNENLVDPFLTGVYAGDPQQLGAATVFGSLVDMENARGSITLGALAGVFARKGPRPLAGTWSGPQGLGGLAAALADPLGDALLLETSAQTLERADDDYRIGVQGPGGSEELRAKRVVVALPASGAGRLLHTLEPEMAAFAAELSFAPIVSLSLAASKADCARPPEGFGFLAPRSERSDLLGCLFMSELFPGRAPDGDALLHCMMGGTRWRQAIELEDDELVERASDSLGVLGLRAAPRGLAITRWTHAVAQPDRNHARRVAALRRNLAGRAQGGLRVAGAYLEGVSVAHALLSGVQAARELS